MKMNVLLNVDSLIPPLTGIGYYTKHLVEGLSNHRDIDKLSCFSQARMVNPDEPILLEANTVFGDRKFDSARRIVRRIPGAYQLRSKMINSMFTYALRNHSKHGIYHEPNYILKPFDGCSIATVHDLSFLHYPQYHPRERVRHMERELPKTLERAQHIITDCQYVKNELISILGVAADRITAVPLGVVPQYRPRTEAEVQVVMQQHHLTYGQYLLAVATLEPRKNLQGLIDAYMSLLTKERRRYPLVLVGGRGWQSKTLETKISQLEAVGELRYLGYLPYAELLAVYSGAGAFAFPSHYEGFGLPPLEAMASGIPVLTAENSAMSEVVADAGILINADDVDDIQAGLEKLLLDDSFRSEARRNGLLRASQFTWQNCIEQTVAVYRAVKNPQPKTQNLKLKT